jgi:hypothetical protein
MTTPEAERCTVPVFRLENTRSVVCGATSAFGQNRAEGFV